MATANIANITDEGSEKIVHLPATVPLNSGPISYEIRDSGDVILSPINPPGKQAAWIAFLDHIENAPHDLEFMDERAMNRPPIDRNLFPND